MTVELHVSGGARTGHRARFDGDVVLIGRDPAADLRLDAVHDRDASARHAELRRRDGAWHVRDLESTNGTFVNGARLVRETRLHDGDRIACGADGPAITVRFAGGAPSSRRGGARTRRSLAVAGVAIVVAAGVAGALVVQRRADTRVAAAELLRRRADSAHAVAARDAVLLAGRLAASDSARARDRAAAVRSDTARSAAMPPVPRPTPLATVAFDVAAVARANGRAVALIAVEAADGTMAAGTAFGVEARGLLVTNRHVVRGTGDAPPRRIAVKFADTDRWLPAHLVRVHADADLATVQVEGDGPFPAVQRVAEGTPAVGGDVVVIGYPAGAETPEDHAFADGVARAAVFRGMVSKVADGVLVIDAFAGRGSSGSPVLDARGAVVGVVYGGARESGGRVAFAAASARLLELLR